MDKISKQFFTVVLAPHKSRSTFRTSLSSQFLIFCCVLFIGIMVSSTYIIYNYLDYCIVGLKCSIMKNKIISLSNEVKNNREYLEKIRSEDKALRHIMSIGTKKTPTEVFGGPLAEDKSYLENVLKKKVYEMDIKYLNYEIKLLKNEMNTRIKSVEEIKENISFHRNAYRSTPNIYPCFGRVGSGFGIRKHPFTHQYEFHEGVDIGTDAEFPVYATADGIVKEAEWVGNYGKLIVIDHDFGYQTRYAHLSKILVAKEQKINRGEKIGLTGDTGRATCVHLHYEVRYKGKILNPAPFLNKNIYFSKK